MRFLRVYFALGCFVLWPFQSFAGDAQWVEIHSPNFSVITDAGDKRGRDVALHFEQMRAVFGKLMTQAHVNLPVPLQIVAFRNSKEMRQLAPVFNGKPTEMAGLFQGGEDRCFIMLDMSVENPWSVVFHEYAHQLMNGNLSARADPWFEEGFAEYFSSIEVDSKEARVGKIPEQTYQILQQMGTMRVADLFRVRQYSKTYNESGDHRNVFYAESGLLVHYIYDNQLIPKLAAYFDAKINQKKTVEEATEQAFGMTTDQLDKALRNYLSSGRFKYYPMATPSGIVAAQFTETPVSVEDAQALLADIDAHSPDHHDRALEEFEAVLRVDPDNAAALRGAGYAYLQRHEYEHASEEFRKAEAHDSKDPRVHYYNALLLSRAGDFRNGAKSEEMKKELEAAIALDPKLADAYSLLAYAQAFSGETEKGLATMQKAVELSPRNESYQINLANIYMTNRKVDDAITLLRSLANSENPGIANQASASLAQAEDFKERSKSFQPRIESRSSEGMGAVHNSGSVPAGRVEGKIEVEEAPRPVRFIKGKLAAVDCSAAPQALLSVVSGGRSLKLHINDSKHVVLLGADNFSCEWKNKSVALNYRERQDGDGDVVSLEIQ
ncbi:MAG TPA: tetratricopeptide repeat protein [Terriglobales bacterium]|jgi:tetratricopeptide (TPR) repeat protein|nr:tetratricopeptide repeat protein [Terriglobales bacterium]